MYGNFCYWYDVAQYYLSHLDRCSLQLEEEGTSRCCMSCSQNKTQEGKVEVRPCSLLILSTIPNWKDADKSAIEEAFW